MATLFDQMKTLCRPFAKMEIFADATKSTDIRLVSIVGVLIYFFIIM